MWVIRSPLLEQSVRVAARSSISTVCLRFASQRHLKPREWLSGASISMAALTVWSRVRSRRPGAIFSSPSITIQYSLNCLRSGRGTERRILSATAIPDSLFLFRATIPIWRPVCAAHRRSERGCGDWGLLPRPIMPTHCQERLGPMRMSITRFITTTT